LALVCALLIWRHRSNIQNLMNGTESRIGSKKKSEVEQLSKGQI
jgi:glycerol-3-phosphate acyltransferase PlsY